MMMFFTLQSVIPGLDPGISRVLGDGRVEPGHDG